MHFEFTHRFAAPVADVVAMYADEGFSRERARATGATQSDILIDGTSDGAFHVVIRRTMATENVRSDFRGLLGSTISVNYTEAWTEPEADSREATFAVEIVGAPARAAGSVNLAPDGAGSRMSVEGTVTSSAFLFSAAVAQAVGEALAVGIEQEFDAADVWLAGLIAPSN
jgi:hypothetical protein